MAFQRLDAATGSLRVGGREAAALAGCVWIPTDAAKGAAAGWTCRADVPRWNDVWLRGKGPFELRLFLRNSTWRWRGVTVTYEDLGGGRARCVVAGTGEPESLPPIRPTTSTT